MSSFKTTTVVNFVGGPSSGKSLLSALTFAEFKMMHKSSELVQEYAKTLVWKEEFEELNCQFHVSMEQYRMLKAIDGKVEYAVIDSPLLLGLYYNRAHATNVSNVEKTESMILKKMQEFNNVYIFLERNDEFPFEIAGRIHNESQSKKIDEQLLELLQELGLEYLSVKSDKTSIHKIIDYVLRPSNETWNEWSE